jgi:hypothetical protein
MPLPKPERLGGLSPALTMGLLVLVSLVTVVVAMAILVVLAFALGVA